MSISQMVLLVPASVIAAVFDWRYRRIPNALVATIALLGILMAWVDGGLSRVMTGAMSATLAMGLCLPLYVTRGIAGGDVKLIVASGFWWTLAELWMALAATAIGGAVLAIAWLCLSRDVTHVPYALAIAGATVGTTFFS